MRQIAILLLLLGTATNGYTQNTTVYPCSNDSTENKKFLVYLDTLDISKFDADAVYDRFFEPRLKDDCFCNLLLYVRVFEYLLDNGLDLEYNFINDPYINNSTNLPEDSDHIILLHKRNKKYLLYTEYLRFKKNYEENVMREYERTNIKSLHTDIENIIHFGIYGRPIDLRSILIKENSEFLLKKLINEKEIFLGDK